MTSSSHIPLSPCTLIRVSGPDAQRFLNGQLTNDLDQATSEASLPAAALNTKGQLEALCWIHRLGEEDYLLDAPLSLREPLLNRLDRYLIADEVTLHDESDQWSLRHDFSQLPIDFADPTLIINRSARYGPPGHDLLSREEISLPTSKVLTSDFVEDLRISHGVPAWGTELTQGLLPPEAGLDRSAISYDKGCYLGQEVISRMKRVGKINRHLVQLQVPSQASAPTDFLHEGQPAGTITSVSPLEKGGQSMALGFRHRKFESQERFALPEGLVTVVKRLA